MPLVHCEVTDAELDFAAHLSRVAHPAAGAVASFIGTIRNHDPEAEAEVVVVVSGSTAVARSPPPPVIGFVFRFFSLPLSLLLSTWEILESDSVSPEKDRVLSVRRSMEKCGKRRRRRRMR